MEEPSNAKRAGAVAAAAAHDFNNELTVILSSVTGALSQLEPDHPSRALLLEIRAAAQRCVWMTSALLNFSARLNSDPVRASFEYLVDE
jgi:signal transduction histidine kinase